MNEPTSLSLLERVRRREPEAWERFVHLYGPVLTSWCRFWNISAADGDDLAQEVYQAVAAGVDDFRRDRPGDSFRAWLKGVARHKGLDLRRRQRGPVAAGGTDALRALEQAPELPEPGDEPQTLTELYHRALALIRAEFEPRTWQAFWRVTVDGLTPAVVASELGLSNAAVRMAKSRVLRRLREEVGEIVDEPTT